MFAAIDLGSNSFRLQINEYRDGSMHVVHRAREPNRLAAGLDSKNNLTEEAFRNGIESLKKLRIILETYPIKAVRAVATHTLRVADNAQDFLLEGEKALGYPIEVISGEEEGRLIYIGVANTVASEDERRLVVDIGGGSTELVLGNGAKIRHVESFGVGTVSQSLTFFPGGIIDAPSFDAAILSARSHFEDALPHYRRWRVAYGSSGTIRALAEIIERNGIGDGLLNYENLNALRKEMIRAGRMDKLKLAGIRQERVASIVGGLAILIALLHDLNIPFMQPIQAGLRVGIMWDLHLRVMSQDRRELSISEFMRQYAVDRTRAEQVAKWACALYADMKPDSGTYAKLLYWSALIHEAGIFVSPTDYHKHGAYLVNNADMAGFTAREQKQMGMLLLGQKGNLRKLNGILENPDAMKAVLALRLALILTRAKVSTEKEQLHVRLKNRLEIVQPKSWTKKHPTLAYWLQREHEYWKEVNVELSVKEK